MPGIVYHPPPVHAVTTVCQTQRLTLGFITGDDVFHIVLKTCGTGDVGTGVFTTVSHNVTLYCNIECFDIKVRSWRLEFLGLNFFTTSYNHTTAPATPGVAEGLSEYMTFSNVDFVRTYVSIRFDDIPPNGGPPSSRGNTFAAIAFVGTYHPFRWDWSDFNNDGVVNSVDMNNVSAYHDRSNSYWDFYGSGTVGVLDEAIVAYYYGKSMNLPNFPGQGCTVQTFNNRNCLPLDNNFSILHPSWKDSCPILPQPDQSYCNQHAS
jgi:hypothetical protein